MLFCEWKNGGGLLLYSMDQSPDSRRRWFGAICLTTATLMLALGLTVLKSQLAGEVFVYYWLGCTIFTGLTMVVALLDLRAVRLRSRQEETELVKNVLQEFAREKDETAEE
jgi:hypothetical protein